MNILVTGAAGFIGMHVTKRLLEEGHTVVGLDNMNNYYSVQLKKDRLSILKKYDNFKFELKDLSDKVALEDSFKENNYEIVINLAAQAGVRYSLENPTAYIESNITGFINILECSRLHEIKHLIYASSSSVYGSNIKIPFSTMDSVDHPVSLYAATKKSNELMAHTYSHLYDLPTTGLRFFTVYGPYGRPDMAYYKFTKNICEEESIDVYNNGDMMRDFTYIDDIVEGINKIIPKIPSKNEELKNKILVPSESYAPYKVYNIGNNKPTNLMDFIKVLEKEIGIRSIQRHLPMQPGDVKVTYADIDELTKDTGFKPRTTIDVGLAEFVRWFKDYYNLN